jgi:glycosyltransferase involved in cell wall biosynthesis
MKPPLISCVVPSFNSVAFVGEALDSIAAQTYRPIEIIVADDGSTDGTRQAVRDCGFEVKWVTQPDRGPAATRNLGLAHAVGELVAFLDADDLWNAEKLSRQYECFLEDPRIQYCVTYAQMFWVEGFAEEGERFSHHHRGQPIPGYATTTLLARRALFERIGTFDESLSFSDAVDWFMRASGAGVEMKVLAEVLTYHRMHDSNLSRRQSDESRAEYLRVVRAQVQRRRQGGGKWW